MDCTIRMANAADVEAIEALERLCFSLPMTREQLIAQLPDGQHELITAKNGEELLGYAGMMYVLDEGYISNVAVSPEHRRDGVGGALVAVLLERAAKLELSFVTLEVRESNAPAKALYAKYGFVPVGRRKRYYSLPTEDAILMTCFLK